MTSFTCSDSRCGGRFLKSKLILLMMSDARVTSLMILAAASRASSTNHLRRSPAPLNFGMPSACARLRAWHSCQNGEPSPSTSENKHRRKQNEYFKETDWAHGIAVGPECNPGDGADLQRSDV